MKTTPAVMVVLSVGLSFAQPACADDEKLGKVNFETSCKPEAQKLFNQGNAVSAFVLVPRVATEHSRMR